MCVDHLGELLDDIIEGVVIAPRHVILPDLLVESRQPEKSHDISIRPAHSDIQRFLAWNVRRVTDWSHYLSLCLTFVVPLVMVRPVFEEETHLASVAETGGQVERGKAAMI